MSKYKQKAMKQHLCLCLNKINTRQCNGTIFMSKYKHKGNETTFMSKYKHKAMKQYLCLNINKRQ